MQEDFCEYCDAALPAGEKLVTVYRHRQGRHFIFERVPAQVCPRFRYQQETIYVAHVPVRRCRQCGELYYEAAVYKRLETIAQNRRAIKARITFPIGRLHVG